MMNSTGATYNCDASLGPTASTCGAQSRFDFTLAFEQSVLSITPYAILLSAAIPRVFHLWTHTRKVAGRPFHLAKLFICAVFASLQLAVLISWSVLHGSVASKLGVASSALGFATALVMTALSYLEHERSVRPSTILCTYLLLSVLFDVAQCRTLWLLNRRQSDRLHALPSLFTAALAAKVVMLLAESLGKTRHLVGPWRALKACPEALASVFSRGAFWWLNELLTRGFSSTLDLDTLYETDEALRSEGLLREFKERVTRRKPSKYRLPLVIVACLRVSILKTVIARLFMMGFKFTRPFLLQYIIEFVQNDQQGGEYHQDIAYSLIAATGLFYIGTAVATGFYNHHLYRGLTMIRGGLVSLLCAESLGISTAVASEMASLTLIGPDVDVINGAFSGAHDLWANPLEIGLATWLLARQLGVGCVGPIGSALLCFALMSQLPKHMGPAVKAWNIAIQKRVSVTSSVVGSVRETKMLGLVPVWLEHIQSLRVFELKESKRFRTFIVFMNILGNLSPSLAPMLTFGITLAVRHANGGSGLDISTAFTSLSIMGLMMQPLASVLFSFPSFVSSLGIFERVETFLAHAEFHETVSSQSRRSVDDSSPNSPHSGIELSHVPSNSVKINKASFSANIGEDAILRDITLSIRPGDICAVTGNVGSGKSLLLQALLGELAVTEGDVSIDVSQFGYCSQSAWLFKGTIRDNIVGWMAADVDEARYDAVIKACGLDKDFTQLVDGDRTVLTSKGSSLSGGQRHRVALARAVFAAPPVFVIDDIFSSLDQKTQIHVWEHVFGPTGLARRLGSAVVIATHSLRIIQKADHVVVMDKCRIARQGPYTAVADAASLPQDVSGADTEDGPPIQKASAAEDKTDAAATKEKEINDQIDNLLHSQGDTSLYWYYLKSIGWKYAIIALSSAMGMEVAEVFRQIWLKWWTEANTSRNQARDGMYYGVYCVFSAVVVITIGFDVWFMFVQIIPKSASKLHWNLLKATMRAPMSFFAANSIGSLVNRFSQDMTLVDQDLPTAVFTSIKGFFSVIGTGALVMLGSAYLAACIPVGFVLLYALQKFYLRTSRQLRLLQLHASSPLFSHLVESGDGIATIRALRWEAPAARRAIELLDRSQRPRYLLYAVQRWLTFVLDGMVGGLAVVLVVLAVVVRQSSAGTVAVSFSNVLGFGSTLAGFITSWTQLETSLGAIARLRTFEQTTPREVERPGTAEPPADWPSRGGIEMCSLSASYKSSEATDSAALLDQNLSTAVVETPIGEDDQPVLRQVSASIQPGQKVAICGRTGSGKSSLLLTLYQLIRYSGTTLVDGVDISLVPLDTLRSRLITVPQEPVIFPGTIRFNLLPGSSPWSSSSSSAAADDDNELLDALAAVSLKDAVLAVEGGLDANVADASLSHGQKQLLCLARALVRKSSREDGGGILVLDEATSSVDAETERMMVEVVAREFASYTVLAVAHRLESVRGFDKMLVLNKGVLVRVGTPQELIGDDGQLRV
ncbi:hypothetical protein PWT90_06010 [Aphanocladium album]|nr:hypothetical protein PWT90_06010 [Aphanocladium album]